MIIFSLASFRIGDERVSLLARVSGVTYSDSWPLVIPVDRLPAGLGVQGLPVTASTYDFPGANQGFLLGDSSGTSGSSVVITSGDLVRLVLPNGDAGAACVHM